MRLKLNCFVLSKQVVLEGALRAAGLRQRRPDDLHARVLSRPPLEKDARERWCAHFLLQGDTAAAHGSQGRRCQNASMESWSLLGEEEDQGNQENADHPCKAGSSDVGWRSLALSTASRIAVRTSAVLPRRTSTRNLQPALLSRRPTDTDRRTQTRTVADRQRLTRADLDGHGRH